MKRYRIVSILLPCLLLLSQLLAACSAGHTGSNVIAFIRDGQVWTSDPDGANAFAIIRTTTPVVGFNWSPTHQLLAFRSLDESFAKTTQHPTASNVLRQIGDIPSTMNTVGVDGGTPITLAFSNPDVRYSNALWNSTGNRLLYRQTGQTDPSTLEGVHWWISQNDQPGGIAVKAFPGTYALPSFSYENALIAGISQHGIFTTDITGAKQHYVTPALPGGHPLPASLERVLWQPAHDDSRFLYAITAPNQQNTQSSSPTVQLLLSTLNNQTTTLATCRCTQFAWSPDGNAILYSTGSTYTILKLADKSSFSVQGEERSVPYWSPDSRFLLIDGQHALALINVSTHQQTTLLSDQQQPSNKTSTSLPTAHTMLQPAANSVWAADSQHFLFLTNDRLFWQHQRLNAGKGVYTVTINNDGQPQGAPVSAATGNITQAGWTYQDANTSFLYPATSTQ
jgi:Tol biopolymer transport system component